MPSKPSISVHNLLYRNSYFQLPSIRDVLHLHQPVCCYILEQTDRENHTNKKNLALSMRASLVQRGLTLHHLLPGFPLLGCISSREDHGYVVSAGISGVNFFLPFKALPSANNDQLTIGNYFDHQSQQ
jgi:rRNA biogenesis protein RRP5